jgi:hypothetical protein
MSWLIGLGICLAMGTAIGFLHGLGVTACACRRSSAHLARRW